MSETLDRLEMQLRTYGEIGPRRIPYEAHWIGYLYGSGEIHVELVEVQYDERYWGPLSDAEYQAVQDQDWDTARCKVVDTRW